MGEGWEGGSDSQRFESTKDVYGVDSYNTCQSASSACSLMRITDFGAGGESVEVVESQEFIGDPAFGTATTYLHKVRTCVYMMLEVTSGLVVCACAYVRIPLMLCS